MYKLTTWCSVILYFKLFFVYFSSPANALYRGHHLGYKNSCLFGDQHLVVKFGVITLTLRWSSDRRDLTLMDEMVISRAYLL